MGSVTVGTGWVFGLFFYFESWGCGCKFQVVVFINFSLSSLSLVNGRSSPRVGLPRSVLAQWVFPEPAGEDFSHYRSMAGVN